MTLAQHADLHCIKCEYRLVGAPASVACAECGYPVKSSLVPGHGAEHLVTGVRCFAQVSLFAAFMPLLLIVQTPLLGAVVGVVALLHMLAFALWCFRSGLGSVSVLQIYCGLAMLGVVGEALIAGGVLLGDMKVITGVYAWSAAAAIALLGSNGALHGVARSIGHVLVKGQLKTGAWLLAFGFTLLLAGVGCTLVVGLEQFALGVSIIGWLFYALGGAHSVNAQMTLSRDLVKEFNVPEGPFEP